VSVEPFGVINLVGKVKRSLALNANFEKQASPPIANIALGSVAVSCPYSAVTRTSRADFFSGAGVVHVISLA
jgi:hypothetical protein